MSSWHTFKNYQLMVHVLYLHPASSPAPCYFKTSHSYHVIYVLIF